MVAWLGHVLFLAALAASEIDPQVLAEEEARIQVIHRVTPPTITVFGAGQAGGGSGVLISPEGHALTNYHVTREIGPALRAGLPDGTWVDAVLLGIDPVGDLAIIQLIGRDSFPAARMGDSDQARVGQEVLALGNPFLLAADFQPTVTWGIISGLHRYQHPEKGSLLEYIDCIQTDAAINPGNSGGPLFNLDGELIGINGRISLEKRGRISVGVGYAISMQQARHFLLHLRGGLIADHGNLELTVADAGGKLLVDEIATASSAYRRGLRAGDEVLMVAGRRIATANEFKNLLGILPAGWRVEIVFRRDGAEQALVARLRGAHREGELAALLESPKPRPPGKQGPRPVADRPLPPEVAKRYEAKPGFSNYRSNQKERDAALGAFLAKAALKDRRGRWRLAVTTPAGADSLIELSDEELSWSSSKVNFRVRAGDWENSEPAGSGGLLMALGEWRRMQVEGMAGLSRCDFAGGYPAMGVVDRKHAAAIIAPGIETERSAGRGLWIVDPATDELRHFELRLPNVEEPCEIAFADYRAAAGGWLPHRIMVSHGGTLFAELLVRSIEIEP